ncbi:hypothetical protein ACIPJ2_17945 [Curtobacterium sp. NPDC090217]|uniref:hypothetical protein n=1 Tax=Curtobacterium sp. NPDC090217 TaxID=3363970 RepID=UPI00382CA0F6
MTRSAPATAEPVRTPSLKVFPGSVVLGLAVVVAVVLVGFVVSQQRLQVVTADGISYLSIAQQYAHGDVAAAVNAYWSPMVSWLMAPLIAAGVGLTDAFGAVSSFAAAVVVGVGAWLAWTETRRVVPALVYVVAVTPAMMAAAPARTPDLLVVAWVIGFLWSLRWADRTAAGPARRRAGAAVVLGVAVALGYFVKLYLLPVAVVSVVAWLSVRWWSARRHGTRTARPWLTPAVVSLAFALVVAPWVGALSAKYETPMLGSSFGVNFGNKFSSTTNDQGWPFLPVPPNDAATTPNEDFTPSVYGQGPFDRPTDTPAPGDETATDDAATDATVDQSDTSLVGKARYYVEQRLLAFPYYVKKISDSAPATLPIGVLFAAAVVVGAVRFRRSPFACTTAVVGLVYFLGYAAITSASSAGGNVRYYWPLFPVSVLLAAVMLPAVWRTVTERGVVSRVVVGVAVGIIAVASVAQNLFGVQAPFVASTTTTGALPVFSGPGKSAVLALAEDMVASGDLPTDARIIGTNTRVTASLALLVDAHAYGRSGQGYDVSSAGQRALFSQVGVQYFLQFDEAGQPQRDYDDAGVRVGSFTATIPCSSDAAGVPPTDCRVDVVRIDP